jgi:hypothetical protein
VAGRPGRRGLGASDIPGEPRLIIQIPRGGALARALEGLREEGVVVELGPTDPEGNLEAETAGEVVLSVPSPETLEREPDEVRRVIARAGTGTEPLVVVVEAAEELRQDELASVLDAAGEASRPVILRVVRQV